MIVQFSRVDPELRGFEYYCVVIPFFAAFTVLLYYIVNPFRYYVKGEYGTIYFSNFKEYEKYCNEHLVDIELNIIEVGSEERPLLN